MPRISEFYGIVIAMFYNDHAPPHFHAIYGSDEVLMRISDLSVIRGKLPKRASALVLEWAELHVEELEYNWELARIGHPLNPIKPLS